MNSYPFCEPVNYYFLRSIFLVILGYLLGYIIRDKLIKNKQKRKIEK